MNGNRSIKRTNKLGDRYPRRVAYLRVAIGVWLLVLTAILYRTGHAGQWPLLLIAIAVLHFALAYRLFRVVTKRQPRRMSFR